MNPDDPRYQALLQSLGLSPGGQPRPLPSQAPMPSTVDKLGAGHAPSQSYERDYDRLVGSPFADTLRAVAGTPTKTSYSPYYYDDGTMGEYKGNPASRYNEKGDEIMLTAGAFDPMSIPASVPPYLAQPTRGKGVLPDWVLSHEMGHRYAAVDAERAWDQRNQYHEPSLVSKIADQRWERGGDWIDSIPQRYARTSPAEHTAEAFANAIAYMRNTDRLPPDRDGAAAAAKMLPEYEHQVPGTSMIVQDLAGRDVYLNHPINRAKVNSIPGAQADATATRAKALLGRGK